MAPASYLYSRLLYQEEQELVWRGLYIPLLKGSLVRLSANLKVISSFCCPKA